MTIEVFSVNGKKIDTVQKGFMSPGKHLIKWFPKDNNRIVYILISLQTSERQEIDTISKKVLLMK